MGPAQSTVAWPGCSEDERDHHDGLPKKQGETRASLTKHQIDKRTGEQHLTTHDAPYPDTADELDDSHQVSVNPLYEFALCRKIKKTFIKGDSQTEVNEGSSSLSADDDNIWSATVVSAQPQSLSLSRDSQVVENEIDTEESGHQGKHSTDATKHAEASLDDYIEKSEQSERQTQSPRINEQNILRDRAETIDENYLPQGYSDSMETVQVSQLNSQSKAQTPPKPRISTEMKATQTTLPHPGDFTLAPPPPRPVMISVSTPPDETSPAMFYKLSQQQALTPTGSYMTDDSTLSSPVFESDASDAGYVHLRGRFGSGGATAAGAAASGASESASNTPEVGRRKKSKKKEEKSIEYVLRQLSSLGTPQEKLTAMTKTYTDLLEEQKALQLLLKQHQRKMNVILREKDQLQSEHNQVVMKKCKLETLCRELQKQNKAVKDESLLRAKEEDEKRKLMSAKFQTSIAEIQQKVNDNHAQNLKLHEENQELSQRLRTLVEKHQDREEQLDRMTSQHRDLELRMAQTRLQQASQALKEEQEMHLKEKEKILLHASEGKKQNALLEAELKKYKERYEEFQDTIDKSGQMFQKMKFDIDRMGDNIKKLEKEGERWKNKWESSRTELHLATEEKSKCEMENQMLKTKVTKLESLCRALQSQLHQASKATSISNVSELCTEPTASSSSFSSSSSTATSASLSASTMLPQCVSAGDAASEPDAECNCW